jgi:hypothetical protein
MVKEIELVPVSEVKEFAYKLIEWCKQRLLKKGSVPRACWIFTQSDKLPKAIPGTEFTELMRSGEGPADEMTGILAVDLNPDDGGLISIASILYPHMAPAFDRLRRIGHMAGFDAKRIDYSLVRHFLAVSQLVPNDLIAQYMSYLLKETQAYAYVHHSEQWFATSENGDRQKLKKDLSEEATRQECIGITWESRDQGEIITVIFEREGGKVGEGKVTKFREPRVMPMSGNDGRIVGLLRDVARN